jgi:hypothetical protein
MKTIQATLLIFLSTYLVAQTWKPLEMHGGGKVTGIIFHPTDPQIIYNRTDVAGLNISIDAGNSWKSLTLNVPKDNPHNFTTRNLAIDPVTPTTMYYCSGNAPNTGSSSIFKSMDGPEDERWGNGREFEKKMSLKPQVLSKSCHCLFQE